MEAKSEELSTSFRIYEYHTDLHGRSTCIAFAIPD